MRQPDDDDRRAPRSRVEHLIDAERDEEDAPSRAVGRLRRLCRAVVRALPARGAGVSVVSLVDGSADDWLTAASAGVGAEALEELQFTSGEGPCWEALATNRPVQEPDLSGSGSHRWPAYGPSAVERGAGAVFAFPLRVGSIGLGALDVYRAEPGLLSADAFDLALTFADVALELLLDGQASADDGGPPVMVHALSYRVEVYQAQGMLMVDLRVDAHTAMLRIRAHAFVTGRPVLDVARDIVAGRLRFEKD